VLERAIILAGEDEIQIQHLPVGLEPERKPTSIESQAEDGLKLQFGAPATPRAIPCFYWWPESGLRILPRLGKGARTVGSFRSDEFRCSGSGSRSFSPNSFSLKAFHSDSTISPKVLTLTFGKKLTGTAGGPVL